MHGGLPSRAALRAAVPRTSGTLRLAGLEGRVVIHRDSEGLPHVQAESARGQGFATAQDRLWQMDFDRRRAAGRVSALVGPAAVAADLQMLRFQLHDGLQDDLGACTPETHTMLEGYAAGVNACIDSARTLPIEYTLTGQRPAPWTPADALLVFRVRHILMGTWDLKLWRARLVALLGAERAADLLPDYPAGLPVTVPPGQSYSGPLAEALEALARGLVPLTFLREPVDQGSNNWVLGGARSASGLPLMAGDPHRAPDAPNVYYQNHIACPDFDVVGFSFPGVPGFPHFGHNAHVAWCITHAMADTQDLYVEQFTGGHGALTYRYHEEWRPVTMGAHTLEVKGEAPREVMLHRTHHGPVIAGDPEQGVALSFRYTALLAPSRTMNAVRDMLGVADADALEATMRNWVDPVNNLLYCDTQGNFGYRTRGLLPVRNRDNGWIPVPGWDGAHEWQGFVPFEDMPAVRNPDRGFALTANHRIADADYPHYIGWDVVPGFRAARIEALLAPLQGATPRHMLEVHRDVRSLPALAFGDLFARLRAAGVAPGDPPAEPEVEQALEVLAAWDGVVAGDPVAPLLFHTFRGKLLRALLEPLLGGLAGAAFSGLERGANAMLSRLQAQLHTWIATDDKRLLPRGTAWSAALRRALAGAVRTLREVHGPDWRQVAWRDVHACRPSHPLALYRPELAPLLNPPPVPMAGDGDTVQAAGFIAAQGWRAQLVSVARYVFDPADWERSSWVIPGGASGHPGSLHFADQLSAYEAGETRPMRYDWDRIVQDATATLTLKPLPD